MLLNAKFYPHWNPMNKGNEYVSPKSQFSQNFSLAFRLPSRTRCVENREISRLMPLWQACKQPTQPSSVGHQLCSSVDHWSSKLRSHHRHSGQFHRLHMLLSVSSSNWQSSSTELFMAQHPDISLKKSAMSLICRREVVSGRRPPVCWMSDRHAALLLLTVHLPQLRVPGSGTVFLIMSRLPHLY